MKPARVWLALGVLYAAFFYWYTSFGGPVTEDEVDHYLGLLESQGRSAEDLAPLREFLESDTGDDFVMVNVVDQREPPLQVEGSPPAATADEMIGRYMEYMWPALFSRACHPVFLGFATASAMDVMGFDGFDGIETWDQAAMMRYRSRRDLMEIATNPEFGGRHEFKVAGIAKTIAFPVDPWVQLGDPRLVLALVFLVIGLAWQAFRPRS